MTEKLIFTLLPFFLGLILGHRLSLGRDKRKEFNDLTREPYKKIINQIEAKTPTRISFDKFIISQYFNPINKNRFLRAAEKYTCTDYDFGEYDPETGTV